MSPMVEVDVASVWKNGYGVFTHWLVAASLVTNLLCIRLLKRLTFGKLIVTDLAISGLTWLFAAVVPIPLYAYVIGRELLCRDCSQSITWVIPIGLSAALGALLGVLVLRVARERVTRSAFVLLAAFNLTCIGIAVWRMVADVIANPPEA
jgi:hypothetical protein